MARLRYSDVTPKAAYLGRRQLMAGAAGLAAAALLPAAGTAAALSGAPSPWSTADAPSALDVITGYNNFYEFGTDKGDPAANAGRLTTAPWTVAIDGLCDRPGSYALDDIVRPERLEERIYRLRCVEGWSMVIPWIGLPLAEVIAMAGPQSGARYVAFETLERPSEMPGQSGLFQVLDWPYVEGLRIDEASHPLTLLAVGLYGETLPNQNGAPIRLVVPWKYGFKSIKSVVRISFVADEPPATWNLQNPREYGFYSNVNPSVDHPRWSQASERVVGEGLFAARRPTEPFNGYAEAVAGLYAGMDLATFY
jgi:sulfoxide reductase catalytic subunit YedY